MYQPARPIDPEREFSEIGRQFRGEFDSLRFRVLHAAPSRVFEGMVVYADGTDWNPAGTGKGWFGYDGASWVRLG